MQRIPRSLHPILIAAALIASGAFPGPAAADPLTGNLVANPGAESDTGVSNESSIDEPAGWTTYYTGSAAGFTAAQYGTANFPPSSFAAAEGLGGRLFAGGPSEGGDTHAFQMVSVAGYGGPIDSGTVDIDMSVYLGSRNGSADHMELQVYAQNGDGQITGLVDSFVGVDGFAFGGGPFKHTGGATVPAGTRSLLIQLSAINDSGDSYNYAFADGVSVALQGPPPGTLRVYPSGAGRGDITAAGINCIDAGIFMGGTGDCQQSYPHGSPVTLQAHPRDNSRFGEWFNAFDSSPCHHTETCSFGAWTGVTETIVGVFHLKPAPLARELVGTIDGPRERIGGQLDDLVNPRGARNINRGEAVFDLNVNNKENGQLGGFLATSVPRAAVPLIGMDGSSLVGNNGNTVNNRGGPLISDKGVGLAPSARRIGEASNLIGMDGSSLIPRNGNALIGNKGGGLIGMDGSSRQGKPARAAPGRAIVILGTYRTYVTGGSNRKETRFTPTRLGYRLMKTVGEMNLALDTGREKKLNASLLEIVQPGDGRGSAGAFATLAIR